jgi:PAS domain S-box-containing protein
LRWAPADVTAFLLQYGDWPRSVMQAGDSPQRGVVPETTSPASTADPAADVRDPPARDDRGYRELAETIPLIVWRTDPAGRILDANGRWAEYSGQAPARGTRLTDDPALQPDDATALAERWAAAAATEQTIDAQIRLRREDGEYRWFHLRAVPYRDDDGQVTAWVGTCADLYREADRFRLILDSVVEAIVVFDPVSHVIEEVNRGTTELLGRTRDELVGKRYETLLRPAEAARIPAIVGPLVAGERAALTVMLDYQRADAQPAAVEVVLQPVDLPGSPRAIVAIARDVRERIEVQVRLQRLAQAEHARAAELNAVIRAMGEAVVVCAADGTITLTNPAGERLFPDVEERTYGEILDQLSDPDRTAPALGTFGGPVEIQTRADPDRWIELSTYPVSVGVGSPPSGGETIVVMRDVTEARRREAVRETFIGVLSHELRTPVTTIFGGAKLLARSTSTLDEETQRGIFRDIHEEAERLQRLVEDVVALNRFGDKAGEVGAEPVLLQRLIPRVVSSEEGRWPGVTFAIDLAAGLPTVTADPTYVEQVLRNLLSNAAKYGGAGSTVTIVAERNEGEGAREVVVRVFDDGPGFPADETNRLFELFYRSPGTAGTAAGAGIGLFVCARLMAAMGGRIWAAPREGGGAEFGFALAELEE